MIIDFVEIKKIVNQLDHSFINEIIKQPTAENMAKWIVDNISTCYRTDVEETEGSVASYEL
jgi:6-pyruvoyltetrahydropterin/6-carboxytetrahydropterin synthase